MPQVRILSNKQRARHQDSRRVILETYTTNTKAYSSNITWLHDLQPANSNTSISGDNSNPRALTSTPSFTSQSIISFSLSSPNKLHPLNTQLKHLQGQCVIYLQTYMIYDLSGRADPSPATLDQKTLSLSLTTSLQHLCSHPVALSTGPLTSETSLSAT